MPGGLCQAAQKALERPFQGPLPRSGPGAFLSPQSRVLSLASGNIVPEPHSLDVAACAFTNHLLGTWLLARRQTCCVLRAISFYELTMKPLRQRDCSLNLLLSYPHSFVVFVSYKQEVRTGVERKAVVEWCVKRGFGVINLDSLGGLLFVFPSGRPKETLIIWEFLFLH